MKVHAIRLDGELPLLTLRSQVEQALTVHQNSGLSIRIARVPREFLDASNFLHGSLQLPASGGAASLPTVERHVLLPSFRKILVMANGKILAMASLLPSGVLPLPVEALISLGSMELTELPRIDSWIEIANVRVTTSADALLLALAVYQVVLVRDRRTHVAFVFSEEPKCLLQVLGRLGLLGSVHKMGGGPVWVLIPPKAELLEECLAPIRSLAGDDVFADSSPCESLSVETLQSLVRIRPAILETLTETKRKEISALYPREKSFQSVFSPEFLTTLKRAERFVVRFPAKITWSNRFSVSGFALDLSESGIRFHSELKKVPQDAVREVNIALQVDALQTVQLQAVIKRISPDGAECGLWVDSSSVQFKYLVDWIRRSPFAQKTKS